MLFLGGKNSGGDGVKNLILIAFLLGGYLGGCATTTKLVRKNAALQNEVHRLQAKNTSKNILLTSCHVNKAKSLVQQREEHFIRSPGFLHPGEVNIQSFLNHYFQDPKSDRICFGRAWAIQERSFE